MTRKEEREQAALNYSNVLEDMQNFYSGAEWADLNPDESMIAKYLHEKKGYPINLNGTIPSFEETMKDVELYGKYKKDKLIDKAVKWLKDNKDNNEEYIIVDIRGNKYVGIDGLFIEDFCKAMEE